LILAILMAVAIPAYLNAVHESERRTCRANMKTLANAEQAYLLRSDNTTHTYTTDLTQLLTGANGGPGDLQALPSCPTRGPNAYSAVIDPHGLLTIHCTDPDHDNNQDGTTGYQMGRDSQ
jgi:Tfp pilus assembly protein PilE